VIKIALSNGTVSLNIGIFRKYVHINIAFAFVGPEIFPSDHFNPEHGGSISSKTLVFLPEDQTRNNSEHHNQNIFTL
jgi:hypothetical protein